MTLIIIKKSNKLSAEGTVVNPCFITMQHGRLYIMKYLVLLITKLDPSVSATINIQIGKIFPFVSMQVLARPRTYPKGYKRRSA